MKLIIRNARLRGFKDTYDIGVDDEGRISKIESKITEKAQKELDAKGKLVTPAYVNVHVHLDKCLTGEWTRTTFGANAGSLDIIPLASEVKRRFTEEDILNRSSKALEMSIINGTTAVRAFADVDTIGGLTAVKALLKVKEIYKKQVDLQVVAFPQEGIVRDPGTEELLHKAMELGAEVVGGIPWYEYSVEESRKHIDIVFEIAKRYGKDVHMLVDDTEDPTAKNLEYLLIKTIRENYCGRVAASHCRGALDTPNDSYARKIVGLAKKAEATIVENAHISLMMYGRTDKHPVRRGITRVKEFLHAGVNVAIGQDDIDDPYYPFGRGDMLELAYFMCHAAHLGTVEEIDAVYSMITTNGAKALRLKQYGVNIGCKADLVVLNAESTLEALRMQSERLCVLKAGEIIAESRSEKKLFKL